MCETHILHLNKCERNKEQDGNSFRAKGGIEIEAKVYPMNTVDQALLLGRLLLSLLNNKILALEAFVYILDVIYDESVNMRIFTCH